MQKPVFITGASGVGKTAIASSTLTTLSRTSSTFPVHIAFSALTTAANAQQLITNKFDVKRKDMIGGPGNAKVVVIIDDVNLPLPEKSGAQPPIELVRQLCDLGVLYDRQKHFPIRILDTTVVCCASPPGGGS